MQLTGRHFIILNDKLQLYQQIPRHSPGQSQLLLQCDAIHWILHYNTKSAF